MMAFGVIQAAADLGLQVARDLSVTGFDNVPLASEVVPPLTTVAQPMVEMGEASVDLLAQFLDGDMPASLHRVFDTKLIVRQSTGPAPHERAEGSGWRNSHLRQRVWSRPSNSERMIAVAPQTWCPSNR